MPKTEFQERVEKLIGYHYGLGNIHYWGNGTQEKKDDIASLAKKLIKFFEENVKRS